MAISYDAKINSKDLSKFFGDEEKDPDSEN